MKRSHRHLKDQQFFASKPPKRKKKEPIIYAFIDSQNLNLGVQNDVVDRHGKRHAGWKLDFKRFFVFLKDKYRVDDAFLFVGYKPGNENLYSYLQMCGYKVIIKPTTVFIDEDGEQRVKGNVDTDLVLYSAAKLYDEYDRAIVVSGDGDFLCLYDYLIEKEKLDKILVPNKLRYSNLLTKYSKHLDFISVHKKKLEHQKRRV